MPLRYAAVYIHILHIYLRQHFLYKKREFLLGNLPRIYGVYKFLHLFAALRNFEIVPARGFYAVKNEDSLFAYNYRLAQFYHKFAAFVKNIDEKHYSNCEKYCQWATCTIFFVKIIGI